MQKKKASPYSSSRALFEENVLEEGKRLFESGNAFVTFFDPIGKEAHGNVKEGSANYACRLDFGANDLLSGARCSCKGSLASPCAHLAALFLQLEKETGGYSLGGKEGYSLFLKALVSRGFSPLPYLKRAFKEYQARKKAEGWEGKEAIECLEEALSSDTGYSGFGDAKIGFLLLPFFEEMGFSEEEKGLLVDEIPSVLSSPCRKSFFLALASSESFAPAFLERFEAGLTNGRSYDLLRLFEKEEGRLFPALPPFTLHLLCQSDFRFHGFLPLKDELLRRGDEDGIASLCKNAYASLPGEEWESLGKRMEEEGKMALALSCYKRAFGSGGGDFPTLCSYWKGLSEEEKKEKEGELLASLSNGKLLSPFLFLLGNGKQSDIPSFILSDFPCLQEELAPYPYQSILAEKIALALKKKGIAKEEEKAIWDCFASFPFLSPYLLEDEAKELSKRSPSSRSSYLSLLKRYGFFEKEGFRVLGGKACI